ncbi:SRPBCC domain-containing protein [Prevotella sp. 10(H)]|uniref:SRPBCC domain-containing protein n=1 Tax=Prevotella sp. 10(H) TaxID=1158294 RepID=UPI0004A76918|nr:SRPBCC domain-containing protein [Prevotella sp. 10(H)]
MEEKRKSITVQVQVHAPAHIVWDYWTDPEHVMQWNAASDGWHTTSAVSDLQPGGRFNYRMEALDASEGFNFEGIYDNVEINKQIDYILGDGRQVHVHFEENEADGSIITETFELEGENSEEQQREGWQAILDRFKYYVEINEK